MDSRLSSLFLFRSRLYLVGLLPLRPNSSGKGIRREVIWEVLIQVLVGCDKFKS